MTAPDAYDKRPFGFALMRATKNDYDTDPTWEKDEFGLIVINDPSFYFKTIPVEVKPEWLAPNSEELPDEEWNLRHKAVLVADAIESEIMASATLELAGKLYTGIMAEYPDADPNALTLCLMDGLYKAIQGGYMSDAEYQKK